ncbi:MAG: helix-turn-helix transcriptional regulator [Spirochaetaceae bacterium]|nr:helix-turn-helix transcriptional regulator [Spirochaetaceae bacterium]
MEGMNIINERLDLLIKDRGYSQKEVAQKTNLTESAISHYLKGDRTPKGAVLLNIANALGTTMDYLQGKTDEVKPAGIDDEVENAFRVVARNAKNLTAEDRDRFIRILFEGESAYAIDNERHKL